MAKYSQVVSVDRMPSHSFARPPKSSSQSRRFRLGNARNCRQFNRQKMWNLGCFSPISLICFASLFGSAGPCSAPPLALFDCLERIYTELIKLPCMDIRVGGYSCHHCQPIAPSRLLLQSSSSIERATRGRRNCIYKPASRLYLSHTSDQLRAGAEGQGLKSRHISVIATIPGFAVLKLAILVSAGLPAVVATQMPASNITLTTKTAIYGFSCNRTKRDALISADGSVFYSAYAHVAKEWPYVEGMKGDVTYPTFKLAAFDDTRNSSVIAEVDAFYPHFICEAVQITALDFFVEQQQWECQHYNLITFLLHSKYWCTSGDQTPDSGH
jgi:hypothetical protein